MTEKRVGAAVWVATCAGIGYLPVAPGTFGAAVGLGLVVGLARLPLSPTGLVASILAVATALFFLGVWACGEAEKFFGRTDPSHAVIDEVVGQMITFLARPHATWKWLLAGFVIFRIFDVIKPFPAGRAERAPGGWGIMLDDVFAGAYSLAVLWILGLVIK